MTALRRRMQEELQRRNYSDSTANCYVRHVAEFARFFRRSPDSLGAEEIKQFQLYLIHEKKVSWSTYIQATPALRFFYIKTLGQAFMAEKIPFPKRPKFLPTVLSQDEVKRLLDATASLKHRALQHWAECARPNAGGRASTTISRTGLGPGSVASL